MIERYGVQFADGVSEAVIELQMAFDTGSSVGSLHKAPGFLGAFEHLRRAIDLIFNQGKEKLILWNEWTELMFRAFAEHREIPITGPGASYKTTVAAAYSVLFWLADPMRTKVIGSSTSIGALREKLWKDILRFYKSSGCNFGNPVNHPHPKIQTVKGDDSCGLFGVAVEQGDTDSAVDRIKGRHAPRVLVVIDEGTGAQPAIVEACVNLSTGCDKYQLVMLANMSSYFNEFGKLAEPENGWPSVTVEDEQWKTKRGGLAIHLDGHKSPNVLAGRKKYPGLISQEDLDTTAKAYGEQSARYWVERRGFAPPEGITKTVLSETMIMKFGAKDKATWVSDYIIGAGLDPAFEGGDRCILRFGKCGLVDVEHPIGSVQLDQNLNSILNARLKTTRTVISLEERLQIKVDVTSKEPIHYQIARRVKDECLSRGVEPRYFAIDSTGEGGGLADILAREWSPEINRVEFGGRATDDPVSDANPRKAFEEYLNRVTQLWLDFRTLVQAGQIRNLDNETAQEFCKRFYDMRGNLMRVETKSEMKARTGKSPDDADAVVVLTAMFKKRSPQLSRTGSTLDRTKNWREFVMKRNITPEYAVAD